MVKERRFEVCQAYLSRRKNRLHELAHKMAGRGVNS